MLLLRQTKLVATSLEQHCEATKVHYAKCDDFETKRQFLLDYIEKIVFWDDRIMVCGSVPVRATGSKVGVKIMDYAD